MRKPFTFFLLALVVMVLLAGCSTTVGINTLVPSVVNMTGYKTVAVASVKPYSDTWNYRDFFPEFRFDTSSIPVPEPLGQFLNSVNWKLPYEDTAEYMTKNVEKAVDQGFYKVLGSTTTDRIIRSAGRTTTVRQVLLDEGVDALITGAITNQKFKCYITAEVRTGLDKRNSFYYYLNRSYDLRYEYTVQDVNTLAVLDTYVFERSTGYDSTLIGYLNPDGYFIYSDYISNSTFDFASKFRSLCDYFPRTIRDRLTPHYVSSNLSLKGNEQKDQALEPAYKYAENNMYKEACDIFEAHWLNYGDFVSGYNTAVLYYATGNPDKGIELANEVFKKTGNEEALKLHQKLVNLNETNKAGQAQVNGEKASAPQEQDVIL